MTKKQKNEEINQIENVENLTDDVTTCRKVQGQCLDTPLTDATQIRQGKSVYNASLRHDNARTEKPGYLDLSQTECLKVVNHPVLSNLKQLNMESRTMSTFILVWKPAVRKVKTRQNV